MKLLQVPIDVRMLNTIKTLSALITEFKKFSKIKMPPEHTASSDQ